jgi:ABC-type polysaccharide/polyol phosphate export permease
MSIEVMRAAVSGNDVLFEQVAVALAISLGTLFIGLSVFIKNSHRSLDV